MTNSQRLANVRNCFLRWLADQGNENPGNDAIESESILIRGEFYCGRRFRTASHHAVWFIEEDELKIHRQNGGLVCVFSAGEIDAMAADPEEVTTAESEPPNVIKIRHTTEPAAPQTDHSSNPIRRAA